jgi:hypothetical protein
MPLDVGAELVCGERMALPRRWLETATGVMK